MIRAANDPSVFTITINQERVLVGAFPIIMKTDGSFAALALINWCAKYTNACLGHANEIRFQMKLMIASDEFVGKNELP